MKRNEALFYIDDESSRNYSGLRSGWDYDGRGDAGHPNNAGGYWTLSKTNEKGPVTLKRDFTPVCDGSFTLEIAFGTRSGEGLTLLLSDKDDIAVKLYEKENKLYCGNDEICEFAKGYHHLRVVVDLDRKKLDIYENKKYRGSGEFTKSVSEINRLKIGYAEGLFGETTLYFTKLYVNYLLMDYCLCEVSGELPDTYKVNAQGEASVYVSNTVEGKGSRSYFSENKKDSITKTYVPFCEKSSEAVAFETKYLLPEFDGKLTIALKSGDKTVLSVYDCGGALISSDNFALRSHCKNVWQTLRIEADTKNGSALVKLNGKKTKTVELEEKALYIDGVEFIYEAYKDSKMLFSDMAAWNILPEPADYVPEPIPAKKKGDYYVGMNICSLWRTGSHVGWDCITPFDEIKPLMGYYDEGLPEVADWEIKWMCEHGIDFELYCWYSSEQDAPMKRTGLSAAIHGGHFHAKYSDKVKLALLWEAANCAHPKGIEAFKKYLVPYWVDYFFSDPRYMTIDGMAIMSIFGTTQLFKDFGSMETTKEAFDYLRKVVKGLGYKDLIIMSCGGAEKAMADVGLDAVHAYNWGKSGCDGEITKQFIKSNTDKKLIHVVPTVSAGFNNVGWASTRSPNMTPEVLESTLEWCKDEMLPLYDKDSWKSKLCMLSTWNEYGEGTYMCPSNLNRFGYLDAVRKVFCEDTPHTDVAPNESQIKRLGYLHPQDRATIARLDWEPMPISNDKPLYTWTFKNKSDLDKWELVGLDGAKIVDGKLVCKVTANDPYMILKESINFPSVKVSHARIKIFCYKGDRVVDCISIYFKVEGMTEFSQQFSSTVLTDPKKLAELYPSFQTNTHWSGNITGIRFDPIYGPGYFELESVELMACVPHKYVYVNGRCLNFGLFPDEDEKNVYIPLAPKSGILRLLNIYHEWEKASKTITMWYENKKVIIAEGKEEATVNGKKYKLTKAMYMKDGVPMVALADLTQIFDFEFKISDEDVNIITK